MTPLKPRALGRTGLVVSPIAIGGAPFGYAHRAGNWDPYSEEGQRSIVATLHHGLDRGINYIDTAPLYGNGHSETLIGEVMRTRRAECVLASKVWFELDADGAVASVRESLRRLRTDRIDIVQLHGRMYTDSERAHILGANGPLAGLRRLRKEGGIGFIGLTTEEPWTAIPFLDEPDIDVYQIAYNLIYQAAARHFLIAASKAGAGVVTMRTMTSGVLPLTLHYLAPEWAAARDPYEVGLRFVLSDSRIHSGLIGMRSAAEIDRNVDIAANWQPPVDFATLPRLTIDVYRADDAL
ncbi:MAG: aldo/keto reductase [Rhodospirillales bacterium]|nr:aldo/keto reductase [Rhodospirillales bacterium]MDE2198370.1 aldo/keto reductase [Rhodospirillales bacterium]